MCVHTDTILSTFGVQFMFCNYYQIKFNGSEILRKLVFAFFTRWTFKRYTSTKSTHFMKKIKCYAMGIIIINKNIDFNPTETTDLLLKNCFRSFTMI